MSDRLARFRSMCPSCGNWIELGNPMVIATDLGGWTHKDCAAVSLKVDVVERYKMAKDLPSKQLRKCAMTQGLQVTRNGRYMDNSEVLRAVIVYGSRDKFEAAIAVATGKSVELAGKKPQPLIDNEAVEKMVNEKVSALVEKAVDQAIEETKKSLGQYRPVEVHDTIKAPKKTKYTLPPQFERMLQLASQRVHILLVGPTGCGKTFLAERLAESIRTKAHPDGLPFYGISCSVGMSEAQLSGYLLPSGKGGQFEYWASLFVKAYTEGGLFLFDEIDASDGNTMTFMNAALSNKKMFVAQRLEGQVVEQHPDFVCAAAANTYGLGADDMYVGRNQLDEATLRRFRTGMVKVDYDPVVEEKIVNPKVLEFGRKIRVVIREHGFQKTMSTGEMLDMSKMVEAYNWDEKQFCEGFFSSWTQDELSKAGLL